MKANILAIINRHFNKKSTIKKNLSKFLNLKYGNLNFVTLHTMRFKKKFCGFWDFHCAQSYLKETFNTVWEKEGNALDTACKNKFRCSTDLGHLLCRYWQLMEGKFIPKKDESKFLSYLDNNDATIDAILNHKYKIICINDAYMHIDFEKATNEINTALNTILPEKSTFEL